MDISSKTTYLFPFILLYLSSVYISPIDLTSLPWFDEKYITILIFLSMIISCIIFLIFKAILKSHFFNYLKHLIVFLPLIFNITLQYCIEDQYHNDIFSNIITGVILYYTFYEFRSRYYILLKDNSIVYKNIFGYVNEIQLVDVIKINQSRNYFTIFRELLFLKLFAVTTITYKDENFLEYDIKFVYEMFKDEVYKKHIINNAKQSGNFKIRLLSY